MSESGPSFTEELRISGGQLVDELKKIVHEGNVRHILIKNAAGEKVMEFPISIGFAGVLLLPMWAAIAAIAVVAASYTVVITREGTPG